MRYSYALSLLFVLAACGDDVNAPDAGPADAALDAPVLTEVETQAGEGDPLPGFAECSITTAQHVTGRAGHREPCVDLAYPIPTPASGDHYGVWADFQRYDRPVPAGFLVHAMEHGAIVFQHNCAGEGCDALFEAIDTVIAEQGTDPACAAAGVEARFIVAPNPAIEDAAIVIGAWERLYSATCVDVESMRAFVQTYYGQGPEDLCARGLNGEERSWCD